MNKHKDYLQELPLPKSLISDNKILQSELQRISQTNSQ